MLRLLFSTACLLLLCSASFAATGGAEALAPEPPSADAVMEDPTLGDRVGRWVDWVGTGLTLHKENYILFPTWSNRAQNREDSEMKFQLSLKQQLFNTRFYLAYTQKSFWRILDQADSRPFRETNHNPEFFFRYVAPAVNWGAWGGDIGYEHESNGAREPDSRSWDRLYLTPFVTWGNLRTDLKIWHRLQEKAKKTPDDPTGDENPDIEDFYGYGELRLTYLFTAPYLKGDLASLRTRWNFATEKGMIQFDYSRPTRSKNLYLFVQVFSGYGESLIDYNRSLTRYGVGVMFKR